MRHFTIKKIFLFALVTVILLTVSLSSAESTTEEQEQALVDYVNEMKESGRSFTVPLNIGPIYSVIVKEDGIGIVFSFIKSKAVSVGLEAISFVTDLKEMDISLENGKIFTIPAVVALQSHDVGTFVIFNISLESAKAIMEMINQDSPVVRFSFIQGNGNRIEMSVDEVNQALSAATGNTVDIVKQGLSAVTEFGNGLTSDIGQFLEDTYAATEKAIVDAGDTLANLANDAGSAIADAGNAVGDFLGDASEAVGDSLSDAMDSVGSFWNGLWGN